MIATYLLLGAVSLFLCLLAHPIGRLLGIPRYARRRA